MFSGNSFVVTAVQMFSSVLWRMVIEGPNAQLKNDWHLVLSIKEYYIITGCNVPLLAQFSHTNMLLIFTKITKKWSNNSCMSYRQTASEVIFHLTLTDFSGYDIDIAWMWRCVARRQICDTHNLLLTGHFNCPKSKKVQGP